VEALNLAYPDPAKEYILDTDASNHNVGAVLSQVQDGCEVVVAEVEEAADTPEDQSEPAPPPLESADRPTTLDEMVIPQIHEEEAAREVPPVLVDPPVLATPPVVVESPAVANPPVQLERSQRTRATPSYL